MEASTRPEPFDPETGEVIEPQRAIDGKLIPAASTSAGSFIDLLEEGRFSAEAHHRAMELGRTIKEMALAMRKEVKGEINIKLKMSSDGDSFRIEPIVTVKTPEVPRPKSVAWQNERGQFTRFPPGQGQFFGARAVDEPRGPVKAI